VKDRTRESTVRRFGTQSLLPGDGLVEGIVGTPRLLTGYKQGVCHLFFYPSVFLEHKPSVIMVKAQVKQNGGAEVPYSSSKMLMRPRARRVCPKEDNETSKRLLKEG
jgi:hypothetical protein